MWREYLDVDDDPLDPKAVKSAKNRAWRAQQEATTKSAKGTRWCRGCRKQKAASDFLYGSTGIEKACNYILQNVYELAKAQGELAWLTAVKEDDEQIYQLIMHYREHKERIKIGDKAVNTKYVLAQAKEYVRAMTEVEIDHQHELMNLRRFCDWATDRSHKHTRKLNKYHGLLLWGFDKWISP